MWRVLGAITGIANRGGIWVTFFEPETSVICSSTMSLFDDTDDTGDEELDLVLEQAARLAHQMRSVSTASSAEHGVDEHYDRALDLQQTWDPALKESAGDNSLEVDIPRQTQQEETALGYRTGSTPLGNSLECATLHTPPSSSTQNGDREIDAAIRASEEMARALQSALHLQQTRKPPLKAPSDNSSELDTPGQTQQTEPAQGYLTGLDSAFERASLHTHLGSRNSDGDIDAAIRASEEMAWALQALGVKPSGNNGKPLSSTDGKYTPYPDDLPPPALEKGLSTISADRKGEGWHTESSLQPQETRLSSDDYNQPIDTDSVGHYWHVVEGPSSSAEGADDENRPPWEFYSTGVSDATAGEPVVGGITDGATSAHQFVDSDFVESFRDLKDGECFRKSQELRERKRQTEAEYEMMKARAPPVEPETPTWLRIANTTFSSSPGTGELTFDKIDQPKNGDDDYVPLRDYSSMPANQQNVPAPGPKTQPSKSDLTWTKLEQPKIGDDDFVPLRGHHQNEPAKTKGVLQDSDPNDDGVKDYKSSVLITPKKGEDHVSTTRMSSRKLRTPGSVTWEKVEYCNRGDEDFVPLKDYSKPVGSPIRSSKTNSRDLQPSILHFDDDDEFEIALLTSRKIRYDSEGPTAFALTRMRRQRRRKLIRFAKAAVVLLIVVGVAYACYLYFFIPRKLATKRPQYKTTTSHHYRSHLIARHRKEQAAYSQLQKHVARVVRTVPSDEKLLNPNQRDRMTLEHRPHPHIPSIRREQAGLNIDGALEWKLNIIEKKDEVNTGEGTSEQDEEDGSQSNNEVAVYVEPDPDANICKMPFGYLLAESCNGDKHSKGLDNLLQSMFL